MTATGLTAHEKYLMGCPSMPKQDTCCVCGKRRESMHHVVPRSRGGHDGPQLPLCGSGTTGCHGRTEGVGRMLWFEYSIEHGWEWCQDAHGDEYHKCRTDDEWLVLDEVPFTDEDEELGELLEMGGKVDYLIGVKLVEKLRQYRGDRKALGEWLCERYDFSPKSIQSYLTKRIAYGKLTTPEAALLGITKGYIVAQLVQDGEDESVVVNDIISLPREQFNIKYGRDKPAPEKLCPWCKLPLRKKEDET